MRPTPGCRSASCCWHWRRSARVGVSAGVHALAVGATGGLDHRHDHPHRARPHRPAAAGIAARGGGLWAGDWRRRVARRCCRCSRRSSWTLRWLIAAAMAWSAAFGHLPVRLHALAGDDPARRQGRLTEPGTAASMLAGTRARTCTCTRSSTHTHEGTPHDFHPRRRPRHDARPARDRAARTPRAESSAASMPCSPAQALQLLNDHDPQPLRHQFDSRRFRPVRMDRAGCRARRCGACRSPASAPRPCAAAGDSCCSGGACCG